MGECGQIGGPNRSEWESAPSAIAGADDEKACGRMFLLYMVLYMGFLAPSAGQDFRRSTFPK